MALDPANVISLLKNTIPFNNLDEAQLSFIAIGLSPVKYRPGEVIYKQRTLADRGSLFLILDGEVHLTIERHGRSKTLGLLRQAGLFGLELFANNKTYGVSATAVGEITLLKLEREHLAAILEKYPDLRVFFKILTDSYLFRLKLVIPWCAADENVFFISRRHPFQLMKRMIIPSLYTIGTLLIIFNYFQTIQLNLSGMFILLGINFAIIFLWIVWLTLDWANDYSIITESRAVFQEAVMFLYDSRQEAPFMAVLSTASETTQFGRLLNYGNVVIRTYAGTINFPMVRYPQQTKSLVEMVWLRAKQKQGQIDQKVLESTIRAKIGLPGINRSVTQQDITVIETYHPGIAQKVLNWCADISQLRVEEKGSITYHTHWFILIKRLSLPSLVIAGLLTWVIAIIFGNLHDSFGLALLTLFGIVTIGMMGWWMYRYLDWQNDCYVITRDEVQDIQKKPLSNEQKRAAPLENINSVDFQRIGIIGILLNIGTVSIHIGEDTFTFDNVYDPAEVQSELFKKLGEKNFMEKKAALDAEQERMAEWISAYHRVVEAERKGKTPGS